MKSLISEYKKRKTIIKKRLKEFKVARTDKDLFTELCFCVLTPQSKAVQCDKAIKNLKNSGLLFRGSERAISAALRGMTRFHNKKASYLVSARKVFLGGKKKFEIKDKLDRKNIHAVRDWLVNNVKGLGYKEASHFLRNIGLGRDMAILDVHILRNLKKFGVIKKIPKSLTKKNYLEIEEKMREFSRKIAIPLEGLDLLFWSHDTGFVFK